MRGFLYSEFQTLLPRTTFHFIEVLVPEQEVIYYLTYKTCLLFTNFTLIAKKYVLGISDSMDTNPFSLPASKNVKLPVTALHVKLFGTVDSDDNRVETNPPGFQKPVEAALILEQTGIKLWVGRA